MNRAERLELKAKRAVLRNGNAKQPDVMTEIPRDQWRPDDGRGAPLRAWRSRWYLAQLYQEPGKPPRLSVCRAELADDGRFVDGLTWDELQRIKRECGFGLAEAVEVYPPDRDVVNVANLRHLWILPAPTDFGWRNDT
jgi:hypothetical protein